MITINSYPILLFPDSEIRLTTGGKSEPSIIYMPSNVAPKKDKLCYLKIRDYLVVPQPPPPEGEEPDPPTYAWQTVYDGWFIVDDYHYVNADPTSPNQQVVRLTLYEHKHVYNRRLYLRDINIVDLTATYLKQQLLTTDINGFGGYFQQPPELSFASVLEQLSEHPQIFLSREDSTFPPYTPVQIYSSGEHADKFIEELIRLNRLHLFSRATGLGLNENGVPNYTDSMLLTKMWVTEPKMLLNRASFLPDGAEEGEEEETLESNIKALNPLSTLLPVDFVSNPTFLAVSFPTPLYYGSPFHLGMFNRSPRVASGGDTPELLFPYWLSVDNAYNTQMTAEVRSYIEERWSLCSGKYKIVLNRLPQNFETVLPIFSRLIIDVETGHVTVEFDGRVPPEPATNIRVIDICPFAAEVDNTGLFKNLTNGITGEVYGEAYPIATQINNLVQRNLLPEINITPGQVVHGMRVGQEFYVFPTQITTRPNTTFYDKQLVTGVSLYYVGRNGADVQYANEDTRTFIYQQDDNTTFNGFWKYTVTVKTGFPTSNKPLWMISNASGSSTNFATITLTLDRTLNEYKQYLTETTYRNEFFGTDDTDPNYNDFAQRMYNAYRFLTGYTFLPPGSFNPHFALDLSFSSRKVTEQRMSLSIGLPFLLPENPVSWRSITNSGLYMNAPINATFEPFESLNPGKTLWRAIGQFGTMNNFDESKTSSVHLQPLHFQAYPYDLPSRLASKLTANHFGMSFQCFINTTGVVIE